MSNRSLFYLLWSVLTWAMVLLFWNQFIIWQPISRVVKRLYSHIQLNIARNMMHALCQKEFDGNFRQTAKTIRFRFISINNMKFIHSILKALVCFQLIHIIIISNSSIIICLLSLLYLPFENNLTFFMIKYDR